MIAVTGFGGLAEKIVIPAKSAFRLPSERSFEEGAALLLTYATSIHALLDRGRLRRARRCWCSAPPAASGLPPSSSARRTGARVIAAVSSEEKATGGARGRRRRGDRLSAGSVRQGRAEGAAELFKEAVGPDGADVIYDPVGGDYAEPALRASRWEGRYLVVGFPAGIPRLPLNLTLLKSCDVCGVFWGAFAARDPKANAAHVDTLFRLWDEGKISPKVSALIRSSAPARRSVRSRSAA